MPYISGHSVYNINNVSIARNEITSQVNTVTRNVTVMIPAHSKYTSVVLEFRPSGFIHTSSWVIYARPRFANDEGSPLRQYIAHAGPEYSGREGDELDYTQSNQLHRADLNANGKEPGESVMYAITFMSDAAIQFTDIRLIVDYGEEYLAPTEPTSIGISSKNSYGSPVTLSWSGSTQPRRLNPITGYEIQYSDDGGAWHELMTFETPEGYASISVLPNMETQGAVRTFRVRAKATIEDALYSDWVESDTLTKLDDTPQMDANRIRLSKNWSVGEEVVLSWANVHIYWPEGNPLIGYEVQYLDSTGVEWLAYSYVNTSANTGQLFVAPPAADGEYRRFRIRPVGQREAAKYGEWVECRESLTKRSDMVSGESGEIHLPRLLDRNLREICTLYPIKCTVSLKINPLSTANMTILQKDAPDEISVRQFVEVYTKQGSAGIYQISQITHDYSSGTVKLDLQHGLTTLSDSLLPEVGQLKGSVEEVFAALLNYQTSVQPSSNTAYWRFGAYYGTGDYEINYEWASTNLLEGLCEMMEQMGDRAYLDFDQSETPWKLNVMEYPPDISECRLSRNLTSISVDVDSSLLCTRIYPYGAGEGSERVTIGNPAYIDADTKNIYGIIARAEVVDNITDAAVLRTVAEKFLSQHKHPAVSISLGAIDLSDATGEEVDGFHIGWTCRVPLPAYGQTYTEHITGIKWSDVYNAPDEMQLTLANESTNVADSLADLLSAYETSALANKSLR